MGRENHIYPTQSQHEFENLPESTVLQSLVDTYFQHCHGQPYTYFSEATFRHRLSQNTFPTWLLLAIVATASGFSEDPYFQGRHVEATDALASKAWSGIYENLFDEDDPLAIHAVQATSMLAVIDFAGEIPWH